MNNDNDGCAVWNILYIIAAIFTARLGYFINLQNDSWFPAFWAIVDFFFWPIAWIKWLICEQVNMSIIKEAFSFFFN